MPGLSVHHQLPEFTQTYVHQVGDAIQLSYPLSSPSPPVHNLSSIRVFSNDTLTGGLWESLTYSRSFVPHLHNRDKKDATQGWLKNWPPRY